MRRRPNAQCLACEAGMPPGPSRAAEWFEPPRRLTAYCLATTNHFVKAPPEWVDQQSVHLREHHWSTTGVTVEQAQIVRRCFHRRA
jgi:hypothetical protein